MDAQEEPHRIPRMHNSLVDTQTSLRRSAHNLVPVPSSDSPPGQHLFLDTSHAPNRPSPNHAHSPGKFPPAGSTSSFSSNHSTAADTFLKMDGDLKLDLAKGGGPRSGSSAAAPLSSHTTWLIKYGSLAVLVLQNTSLVLMMRYTRTIPGEMYIASTAVVLMEFMKVVICMGLLLKEENYNVRRWVQSLRQDVLSLSALPLFIPSFLYAIQNNLLFIALSHLDATTFQLTYQLKILTTAIFSVSMLRKHITHTQWMALVVLMMGVALVQLQSIHSTASSSSSVTPRTRRNFKQPDEDSETFYEDHQQIPVDRKQRAEEEAFVLRIRRKRPGSSPSPAGWYLNSNQDDSVPSKDTRSSFSPQIPSSQHDQKVLMGQEGTQEQDPIPPPPPSTASTQNPFLGFTTVLLACMSSGFSGVYFEKVLKQSPQSLWMRNIQLGLFGFTFSVMAMFLQDGHQVLSRGFLSGYNVWVWLVVINQALGGLIVAVVVKYADNILKGFATSISIVLSGIISVIWFQFQPSLVFLVGASLVLVSVYVYGRPVRA